MKIEKMDHLLLGNEVQQMESEVLQRYLRSYRRKEERKTISRHGRTEHSSLCRSTSISRCPQDTESLLPMVLEELQKRFVTLNELLDVLAQEGYSQPPSLPSASTKLSMGSS
jgi:hypothetical protein